jgi:hypothetical protein
MNKTHTNKSNMSELIRQELEKGEPLTLDDLYNRISPTLNLNIDEKELRHRLRSRINGLLRGGQIRRVANATYVKS